MNLFYFASLYLYSIHKEENGIEVMEKTSKSDLLYSRLYRRVAAMADGSPFPTVRKLMAEYGVSQATVAPAISLLKERGFLEAIPRQGLFVRRNRKPKLLLVQSDWNSSDQRYMAELLAEAAERSGFTFERFLFDYHREVCDYLDELSADVIVADSITNDLLTPDQIMSIVHSPAPVILCRNAVQVSQIHYVCGDNAASGSLAARYLRRCGHTKIGVLYCEPHFLTPETIVRNFRSATDVPECRLTLLDCNLHSGETPDAKIREFATRYAHGEYDFTALFAVSDHGALIALREFEALGISIPDELSVLGFGNIREPGIERLTTIDTPSSQIADEVIRMATRLANHSEESREYQVDIIPKLVERKTVAPIAIRQVV